MATTFPFKVHAKGEGRVEHYYTGQEMMEKMDVYHQNLDDKGLWIIDKKTGYLRINSNQRGLSARFNPNDLNKRDYTIRTEVIPSTTDNDNFGIVFRYQDRYRYYFVGWDGGGEYLWGEQTLRLYKMVGDTFVLLGSAAIGPWPGGELHQLDVDALNNEFVIYVNGEEVIRVKDEKEPYLTGAFGPCATSQVTSWKSFMVSGTFEFLVEKEFVGEIDQTNYDYQTAKKQQTLSVAQLMADDIATYGVSEGYVSGATVIKDYTVSTSYIHADVHFNTEPASTLTTDGNATIHAFMISATTPPIPPTNFKGTTDGVYIIWSWDDLVPFEEGFEILNEEGRVIASLGRDTTEWKEGPLALGQSYARKLRAFNRSGRSAEVEASAMTGTKPTPPKEDSSEENEVADDDAIIYTPPAPKNFRGMVQSTTAIIWYWDKVETANYYEVWDAETGDLLAMLDAPRFREDGLTPDTLYRRIVTATNVAGTSSKSNEAMTFTDALPVSPDAPPAPLNFAGEAIDNQSIVWSWQEPVVVIQSTREDGTTLTDEEIEAEKEKVLAAYRYRISDSNGEVLYEAPEGVYEWIETNLQPDTAYTHFAKIYVEAQGALVEGTRSNYAYVITLPTEEAIEEEEEALPWPLPAEELIDAPYETEPKERIEAFHTGIGDNLDLKVRAAGERPTYKAGSMRRSANASVNGEGSWPIGKDFDGGTGGGISTHGEWTGWGPGNRYGGGHDPIGHIGYAGFNPDYAVDGRSNAIGHTKPNDAVGYPGHMKGAEIGICSIDSPRENFMYDVQVQGTELVDIEVFEKEDFEFRFKGEGLETVRDYENDFAGQMMIRPLTNLTFNVTAEVEAPEERFETYYKITADVREVVTSTHSFNVTPYVDVVFSRMEIVPTIAEIFQGTDGVTWGPNTWVYNATRDEITTTQNVAWSGFYNRKFLAAEDYSIEFEMGVVDATSDNDFLGFAFRLWEHPTTGKRNFYFFGTDAGGMGLGGRWGLYKTVNAPNYAAGENETSFPNTTLLKRAENMPDNWVHGQMYNIKIEAQGSMIKVYVDGVLQVQYEDTDPSFKKGSWGPTTASQQGVMYRNFTFIEGTQKRIYGATIYDTINMLETNMDVKAMRITAPDVNLEDMFAPAVTAAYNNFISSTGIAGSRLTILGYDATISRDNLKMIFDKAGASGIHVYTDYFYPGEVVYEMKEYVFEEPHFSAVVNSSYSSITNSLIYDIFPSGFSQSIANGETYARTSTYRLLRSVENFIAAKGIYNSDVKIKRVEPISLNPNVKVFYDALYRMHAWVEATTTWRATKTFKDLYVQHTNGEWVLGDFDYHPIVPVDDNGNPYTGDIEKVVYKIESNNPAYEVAFSPLGAKKLYVRTGYVNPYVAAGTSEYTYAAPDFPKIRYRVNNEVIKTFSGKTPGPLATYYSPATLVPEIASYTDAEIKVQLTSAAGDVWLALATNDTDRRRVNEDVLEATPSTLLLIGTEGKPILKPWSGYSRWYKGSVNGVEPFYDDSDGQQDFTVPIDFDGPSGVVIHTWYVDVRGNANVQLQLLNGTGNKTTYANDTVRFYSDKKTPTSIARKWYGPSYTVTHSISLCGTSKVSFDGQVPSPESDPNLARLLGLSASASTGTGSSQQVAGTTKGVQFETIITTHNPNVAVKLVTEPSYDAKGTIFLPIRLEAWIINPIQVPWSPLIHNGYYYLNQREHFLYANTAVTGKYVQSQAPQAMELPYSIRVYCERFKRGILKSWFDTSRASFKGTTSLVDLDTVPGQIMLSKDKNGEYYTMGTYISENKKLTGVAGTWSQIEWVATTPGTSQVKVETSSIDMTSGSWSAWQEAVDGAVIPSPLSNTLRYRVTLIAGQDKVTKAITTNYRYAADWQKGIASGVLASGNGIEMTSPLATPTANWQSDVIDLGANVSELGTITWAETLVKGATILVETMSSPNLSGPWNGSAQAWMPITNIITNADGTKTGKIASNLNRYLRVRYTLMRGSTLIKDHKISLNTERDFVDGLVYDTTGKDISRNVQIVNDAIKLIDTSSSGAYITPPISFESAAALHKVLLNAMVPASGNLQVYTMTAATIAEFDTLQMDVTNWQPLSFDGKIQSPVQPYVKVKVEITPGHGLYTNKTITLQSATDWTTHIQSFMNTKVDGNVVTMKEETGVAYIESHPFDFVDVNTWLNMIANVELDTGTVTMYTSTSDNIYTNWEAWTLVPTTNIIASRPNRYIRFRLEFVPKVVPAPVSYLLTRPDITGTFSNMEYTDNGNGIKLSNANEVGYFIADPLEFLNASAYHSLTSMVTDGDGFDIIIESRTSMDMVNWDIWMLLGSAGEIYSPAGNYIQYRVTVVAAGVSNGEIVSNATSSKTLTDTSVAGLAKSKFTSTVMDFNGIVTALGNASVETGQLSGGQAVRLFTATGSNPNFLDDTVAWTQATALTGQNYRINSSPDRYIAYRLELEKRYYSPWRKELKDTWNGTHTNTKVVDGNLVLDNPSMRGEYISDGEWFYEEAGRVSLYELLSLGVTGVHEDGWVEVYYKIANTPEELSTATENLIIKVQDVGSLIDSSTWTVGSALQYRVVILPGKNAAGVAASPTVTNLTTQMMTSVGVLPEVRSVSLSTTNTGYQSFVTPKLSALTLNFERSSKVLPRLTKLSFGANKADAISPLIHEISVTGDMNSWLSPSVASASIQSKTSETMLTTPIFRSIQFSGRGKDSVVNEEYTMSLVGSLPADKAIHQLSNQTMRELMDTHLIKLGVDETFLTRKRYEVFSHISNVTFSTLNKDDAHYKDGLSPVFAQTTSTKIAKSYTQTKFFIDDNQQVLLSPVPQQGAPVIVKNAVGEELMHVAFIDDDGKLTLWYKGCNAGTGTRTFLLDHANVDPETLEIEVDEDPNQPYTKLVYGEDYVHQNNVVTFRKVYDEEVVVWYKYILKDSFIIDYNYDVGNGQALLTIHEPGLKGVQEVEVTYETAEDTAYYQATELDLNPMRNVLNEGFIYLTNDYYPATNLSVRFNPNTLHADGKDHTTISVIATDRFGNPVVGDTITVTVSDGTIDMKNKVTDMNGMVTAIYTASTTAGEVTVTAIDTTARLEAEDIIHLRGIHPQPRAEVVLSAQEITPDGVDRVKITARIVNENQQRAVLADVLFEVSSGASLDTKQSKTNFEGESYNYVRISSTPPDNIITIKVTVPELGAVGYANLLIKEVAQFV